MTGVPDFNHSLFNTIAHILRVRGYIIDNPAESFGGDTSKDPADYIRADLQQIMMGDFIVLLPGWEESPGAAIETSVASALKLDFYEAVLVQETTIDQGLAQDWYFRKHHGELVGFNHNGSCNPDIKGPRYKNDNSEEISPRASLLDEAKALVTGDRNNSYGPPTQDFTRTAGTLNAYGYRGPNGRELLAHDVAIMVMAVKISRLMWTPGKRDSWADIAGYSGCGYECATEEARRGMSTR